MNCFNLSGRTAVVTGGNKGIGAEVACALAAAGARLVVLGRGSADQTVGRIESDGGTVSAVRADLSSAAQTQRAIDQILSDTAVDILVNNAGAIDRAKASETTLSRWRAVLEVNLNAAFALSRAVGPDMAARGSGKIITIASLLSFQGGLEVASYAASKHAVIGMTKALCNEWAPFGVQVNALAPGYVKTANTAELLDDPVRSVEITARIPAGRWAEPSDLAGAAVFLASSASDYVNGHTLVVDGGWLAR